MRLRTFIGDSMAEAVEQVRQALGADAIIISSTEGENGGFEVTATSDHRDQDKSDAPLSEQTVLEGILRDQLSASPEKSSPAPSHPRERDSDAMEPGQQSVSLDEESFLALLEDHGVPPVLAKALTRTVLEVDSSNAVTALASALEARFNFDPLPVAPRHPVMAVGLPGHGKTVTIAKLAARAAIENVQAQIISTDAERTGARSQANAYGELLKIQVDHVETLDAMGLVLDQRTDRMSIEAAEGREACFIDTAAANPFQPDELKALKSQIDVGERIAAAEPILILSANGDPRGMAETAQIFSELGVSRMIVTQTDIARRLGGVLAAAEISGLSFAQISDTPYLARGVSTATPLRIAQALLAPPIG